MAVSMSINGTHLHNNQREALAAAAVILFELQGAGREGFSPASAPATDPRQKAGYLRIAEIIRLTDPHYPFPDTIEFVEGVARFKGDPRDYASIYQ